MQEHMHVKFPPTKAEETQLVPNRREIRRRGGITGYFRMPKRAGALKAGSAGHWVSRDRAARQQAAARVISGSGLPVNRKIVEAVTSGKFLSIPRRYGLTAAMAQALKEAA